MKAHSEARRAIIRLLHRVTGSRLVRPDFIAAGLTNSDSPNYRCRQLIRAGLVVRERISTREFEYKLTPWGKKIALAYIEKGDSALPGLAFRFATEDLPSDFKFRNAVPPSWAFGDGPPATVQQARR